MSITDQIRKQLDQPDALTMEAIEPLAEAYGQETQQANARLAECIQLLRKGLRSEAIQRAAMKPNLLDWCARLDFPEIDDWFEILKFYGISVPQLLDRVAAQQLQEAIVDEQPLEELLRQHRRLAIGKAPLSWRLKVLRRLAEIDSVNAVWREDQEQWETIRLKQIPSELNRAIEAESLSDVQDLAAELTRSVWVITPPKELCKQATGAATSLIFKQQVGRLQRLIDKLHAAYSEGNETAAEGHYQAYTSHIAQMVSPPPPELIQRAEPAIEWLTECLQAREKVQIFELNSAALENLLQGKASLADLERAYYDVASMQMGIDPILEQRYETKIAQLKQHSLRRTQMYFVGVATTAVTLLVVFGLWQWNRSQQQAISETVTQLQGFIDSQDFTAAEGVIKQLSDSGSAVSKAAEVIALVESLKSKQAAENERRQRVEALIADADQDDPSAIDINKVILAEKEAKAPDEVIRIKRVRANLESYERSVSDIQTASVKKAVTNFESKLLAIEALPLDEIQDSEIDSIVIDINKLSGEFPKALSTTTLVRPALDRAASIKDNARKRRDEISLRQRSMRGLRGAATLFAFTSEMKDYADRLPGDKLARAFSEALSEQAMWRNVEDWNTWCAAVIAAGEGGLSNGELRNVATTLKTIHKNLTGLPGASVVDELEQIAAASDTRTMILKGLVEQFAVNPADVNAVNANQLAQLVTLIAPGKAGKRYFMDQQSRARNALAISKLTEYSKITLPVIINETLQSEEVEFKGVVTFHEEPRASVRKLGELFQRKDFLDNWDNQMIFAMGMVIGDKKLDANLKEFLLEAVIKAAGEGSMYLKDALAPAEKLLGDTREKRDYWFVPAEAKYELSPDLKLALTQGVQKARVDQGAFMARLAGAARKKFAWVGAIMRDNNDSLEAWLAKPDWQDGELFTVVPTNKSQGIGQLTKIGFIRNKQATLDGSPDKLLVGRPLYWLAAPNSPTAKTTSTPVAK